MKNVITVLSTFICIQFVACGNKIDEAISTPNPISKSDSMKLKISIGEHAFTATLYDNATVTAFKAKLPMAINMKELNGNEKYFDLPGSLPAKAFNPGTIQTGDLMLYGSNTLVLFYKSFSTSYSYTPLGRIDNASGLTAALGSGNVIVTFAVQ